MRPIYLRQRNYFRRAYETGEHGWPIQGFTPQVEALLRRLGSADGKTALDLGCGEGRHTILLAGLGYDVVALDSERLAVRKARQLVTSAGASARFVIGDALNLRLPESRFDVVLDFGCLHHIVTRDWPRYRGELLRVLKPNGHLILSVFSTRFKHHAGERRSRNWLVHRNHYDHFFTKSELRRFCARSFELREVMEERSGLDGYYHALLRARSAAQTASAQTGRRDPPI